MSTNRRQLLEAAYVAASATKRRRCLPPRPRVPAPMSPHQRWRERPRCRALHLPPGHPDGVVHAIVGRVAYRCLRTQFVQENRAARVHVHAARSVPMCSAGIGSRTGAVLLKNTTTIGTSIELHTIAPMMLAPCSASSMLSASLRPGRWPGLRALTTPARGTDWQWRDGDDCDDGLHDGLHEVDEDRTRAYGRFITPVPPGTPPVRHNGIRNAHSAGAPRARL